MCTKRAYFRFNIFISKYILTSVLRAATDRRPSKISRLKIETAVSRSNLFLKITKLISIPYNKKWVFFSTFLTSTHSFLYQKSDFYLIKFGLPIITSSIYREYFEKSKKGHNSGKNKISKNKKILFWPILNTSGDANNQVSSSIGKGARPGADRQTHRHTQNGPKTEDLYIFFILYFYFFIGGLKDTNNLTHAQGVNSQC